MGCLSVALILVACGCIAWFTPACDVEYHGGVGDFDGKAFWCAAALGLAAYSVLMAIKAVARGRRG